MHNRSYINGHEEHPHGVSDAKIRKLLEHVSLSANEENLIGIMRVLSDPTKLKIFLVLNEVEEIVVSDLALILDLSQSAVSHALADLRKLGIVDCHKCGQLTCYSLVESPITKRFFRLFSTH